MACTPGTARTTGLSAAALLIASLFGTARPLHAASTTRAASDPRVIGVIGQERISETDVIAANPSEFDRLQNGYELERRQLESKYRKSQHDLMQRQLDQMLDERALQMEAKERRVTRESVLAELDLTAPTEEQAREFYENNKDRIRQPYDEVSAKLREFLTTQRNQAATRTFYDQLRAKHGIRAELGPYRVSVAATGPARGQSAAPVTIVEFGDFQCPYCKQAEASLRAVMAQYPRDVRVVFRNLPLTQIHPNAEIAAQAAVCADRQGKFWEMHDEMYDDQSALNEQSLKSTATRLGLDAKRFSTCITDGSTSQSIAADAKAAGELGLEGTPYFFINGRPLDGNVPVEQFHSIIADELQSAPRDPR